MDQEKTKVWAHRGASGYAPENTLDAFRKAVEMGADGIELDVQMTKDGELVVIHDETIDRVSNGKGWVKDYTYEELKKFNFNKTHLEYTKEEIPTLEQVYLLIKPTNLTINVEIKTGIVFYPGIEERVLELTERLGMKERVIYSSFNHYTIRKIKELDPQAKTGMLYEDGIIDAVDYACDVVKADALHPAGYNVFYPGFLERCRERKRLLHVWTINEEKHMRMLCEAGVDAMITNYPDIAKKIRDEYHLESCSLNWFKESFRIENERKAYDRKKSREHHDTGRSKLSADYEV